MEKAQSSRRHRGAPGAPRSPPQTAGRRWGHRKGGVERLVPTRANPTLYRKLDLGGGLLQSGV